LCQGIHHMPLLAYFRLFTFYSVVKDQLITKSFNFQLSALSEDRTDY
jgi:hypothetical protein